MDDVTKANILKMQGRFSAIEAAIRILVVQLPDRRVFETALKTAIEPTVRQLWARERDDLLLVAEAMRETMSALLDTN